MKNINAITNIFGMVAGGPQFILAFTFFQNGQHAEAIAKIAEGIGLIVVSYCVGKTDSPKMKAGE